MSTCTHEYDHVYEDEYKRDEYVDEVGAIRQGKCLYRKGLWPNNLIRAYFL
jgi:hypothetical protein